MKSTTGPQTLSNIYSSTENAHIQKLEEENLDLKRIVTKLQEALTKSEANVIFVIISKESCVILEQKIDKVESDALDAFDDNKSEVNVLQKPNYLNLTVIFLSLKRDLYSDKKTIKEKEK